jgi:endonuclease/exonuclease/phosphatase family metal-dependent hydrolase
MRLTGVLAVVLTASFGCTSVHFGRHVMCELSGDVTSALPPSDGSTLNIITWNLHGTPTAAPTDERFTKVARTILERRPDFVLLQEVWFRGDADQLAAHLGTVYRKVDDDVLTQHFFGWLIGFRKSGLLVFRRADSAWAIAGDRSSFVPFKAAAAKWRVWEMDGLAGKGFQHLEIQSANRRLIVINTHLQSPYRADEDPFGTARPYEKERRAQITQLADFVDEQDATRVAIVIGDFNTFPGDEEVYRTLGDRFADLTRPESKACRCGTIVDEMGRRHEWIDYVLTRPGAWPAVSVEELRLIRSFKTDCPFSDHHGIEVRLRFLP